MTENREIGNVLWFDQKKGYGFVKVTRPESEILDKEIFLHYTNIQSENNFKKLFPGENISFNVEVDENAAENKKHTARDIRGLYNAPLLIDNPNHNFRVVKKRLMDEVQEDDQ
jgi:cold shock CspA family protein